MLCPRGQPRLSLTIWGLCTSLPCLDLILLNQALSQDTSQPSLSSSLGPGWCLMPGAAPVSPCSTLTHREPRAPPAPGGCWQGGEEILDMSRRQDESTEISTALQEYFLHDPKKKTDNFLTYAINPPNWIDEDIFSVLFLKNTVNSRKTSIPSEEPHAQEMNKCRLP